MQKIMISIRPEWCEKIAPRLKTIEVRKNEPQSWCYVREGETNA